MNIDYKFNKTDSPDAKLIIDFVDYIRMNIHARGKSLRGRNPIKNYVNTRALLVYVVKRSEITIFRSKKFQMKYVIGFL